MPVSAPSLRRHEVREIDRRAIEEFGIPGVVLMENAGRGAVDLMLGWEGPVVVCCGKGNNGGDGFVIARRLDGLGRDVRVLLFARPEDVTEDAAVNLAILERAGIPIRIVGVDFAPNDVATELAGAGVVVDCLLGTGVKGELRNPFPSVIEAINATEARVLAVDLPSGLDCDTGESLGLVVRADVTATFVARKAGFENPAAAAFLGRVEVVDIGVPRCLLEGR